MSEAIVTLRRGTPADAERVAAIWFSGWCDGHLGGVPEELVAVRTAESFQQRASDRVCDAIVAIVNGEVAGFTMVVRDEVDHMYVAAEHRGRGVAQTLMAAAEEAVAASGYEEAWLAVVPSNGRARRFYAKCGWVDRGPFVHQAYGPVKPISVPSHRYTKRVLCPNVNEGRSA